MGEQQLTSDSSYRPTRSPTLSRPPMLIVSLSGLPSSPRPSRVRTSRTCSWPSAPEVVPLLLGAVLPREVPPLVLLRLLRRRSRRVRSRSTPAITILAQETWALMKETEKEEEESDEDMGFGLFD